MKAIKTLFKTICCLILLSVFILHASACEDLRTERKVTILEPVQHVLDAETGTNAIGGGSEQILAQTFTIERNGNLTGIYLPIGCSDGNLEIEIRNVEAGEPGSTVHSREVFSADDIVRDVSVFQLFSLSSFSVSAGDRLAVVLQNESGSCGMARGPEGDSYSRGEGFYDARPNAPGWRPLTIGTGIHDLPFLIVLEAD